MTERLSAKNHTRSRTRPLRLGFVPLNDCAPIVMAHELGLFEKYDLVVKLSREIGWCVATSAELAPLHPEKVLMVRRDFAEECESRHLALIAALIEACEFCDRPENRERVMETLAQPEYLDAPIRALRMSMNGTFDFGLGRIKKDADFNVFSRYSANEPTTEKGEWVLQQMCASGALKDPMLIEPNSIAELFRADIFHQAKQLIKNNHQTK